GMGRTHGKTVTYPRHADTLGFARMEEVVEVAEAVVKVQRDHGDRSDRRHARLKYLLDKQGLDWFRDQVERQLGRPLAPAAPVEVSDIQDHLGWHEQGDGRSFLGVFVENGRIRDGTDRRLRSALRSVGETVGSGVRVTPQQSLLLTETADGQGRLADRILGAQGVAPHGALSVVRRWAMACPAPPTGGGAVAEQKVLGLRSAGAHVTVVSPEPTLRLAHLATGGEIELRRRPYRSGDLAGAWLAIAGTDDRAVNARVWAEAEREGVLLNAVDDLDHCSFIAPAIHREGDITVAVSTSGKSPALAARPRQR